MAHYNTTLNQIVSHLPRSRFEKFVREHNGDHRIRSFSCWKLFVCHVFAQLSGVDSLRDLETTLRSKLRSFCHLGLDGFSRSTMADANEKRDSVIFEKMFNELTTMAQGRAPGHKFRNPLYSLDSSTITLCLSMFPWAKFRTRKGALKIHTLLDHRGHLPSALVITDGKGADIKAARQFHFEPDSIPTDLRRIRYVDPETGKAYLFFTNIFHLSAKEIADIYKARWEIELFFKWIKQNLKIKSFFGTSENAVRIQIW